jgi:hypothetical protein
MRHLFLFILLAITGLFATDWTPPSVLAIGPDSMVIRVYPTVFSSWREQPSNWFIAKTKQEVKDAGGPVKSASQVWTHGIVAYYHGIAVGRLAPSSNLGYFSDREFLGAGLIPAVDALYLADPAYVRPGRGVRWYPDFLNAYKGRWEALYVPAYAFGPNVAEAIVYTLRAEEFVGIDPSFTSPTGPHPDGRLIPVPLPPAANN